MNASPPRTLFLIPLGTLLACGAPTSTEVLGRPPCHGHPAGELLLTELMNDPEGDDNGHEYFEVFNATQAPIDLAGLTLLFAACAQTTARGSFARLSTCAFSTMQTA